MFRPIVQSARCVARQAVSSRASSLCRPAISTSFLRPAQFLPPATTSSIRWYSAGGAMSKTEVEGRIMDLLKGFDKIKDASKVSANSHFSNDLSLDSLDTVEVVMAIEEEFSIEIPDKEADKIQSIDHAVEYILNQPDAH